MTSVPPPEDPWVAADPRPPIEPGWGGVPSGWGDPSGNPYAPRQLPPGTAGWYPEPPGRPWYRAPGQLIGAATFSAVAAWVVVICVLFASALLHQIESAQDPFSAMLLGMFLVIFISVAGAVGLVAFGLSLVGVAATIPLAVVWFRDPDRSTGGGVALIHAVLAWAAMTIAIFAIPN